MELFKDKNPDLMKEYDWEKNDARNINLDTITPSSNKKVFWRCCKCGGSWEARFADRNRRVGCPYCSGKKALPGYNDLATKFPDIAREWDYDKNGNLLPSDVTAFSMKAVNWICKQGHSYSSTIARRTAQGQGCPYCAGKRVLVGFNDLGTKFPEIAGEWDLEKNAPLLPNSITYGSSKKVWWKCHTCGYEWIASVGTRTSGEGCKVCGNKRGAEKRSKQIIEKGSSISEKTPWLLKEWDYEKNKISPDHMPFKSDKRCWWICEKGHSYDLRVADKTGGQGCPYCAGKRVLKGFNDLESHDPDLMVEWDYENNTIKPSEITYGSKKKVFWKCQNCQQSYLLSVQEKRTRKNKYCASCRREIGSSIPEQAVFYYVKKAFPDAINGYRNNEILGSMELDIYIPSIKTGIEYDGQAWHGNQKRDKEKTTRLVQAGIQLIRMRESGTSTIGDGSQVITVQRERNEVDYTFLQEPIELLLSYLSGKYSIQKPRVLIDQDINEITVGFLRLQKENSLAECYPDVAKEIHPTKNQGLNPKYISCRSGQTLWWQCSVCGHEWKSRVIDRTTKDYGCKVCGNTNGAKKRISKIIEKEGSLADRYPELLEEWDYDKNAPLQPSEVTAGSRNKVWWKCHTCGHEWETAIYQRTSGQGCPQCYREGTLKNQIMLDIKPGEYNE